MLYRVVRTTFTKLGRAEIFKHLDLLFRVELSERPPCFFLHIHNSLGYSFRLMLVTGVKQLHNSSTDIQPVYFQLGLMSGLNIKIDTLYLLFKLFLFRTFGLRRIRLSGFPFPFNHHLKSH